MVHEDQAGLVPAHLLHALAGVTEPGSGQSQGGKSPDEGTPEDAGLNGMQMGILGQRHDFFVVQFSDGGFHKASSRPRYLRKLYQIPAAPSTGGSRLYIHSQ